MGPCEKEKDSMREVSIKRGQRKERSQKRQKRRKGRLPEEQGEMINKRTHANEGRGRRNRNSWQLG